MWSTLNRREAAGQRLKAPMLTEVQIAGHKVASINPATGEVVREFVSASEAEVHEAVARARAAQPAWNALGVQPRIRILKNFQGLLQDRKRDVARVITSEAGKPLVEALLTEVLVVVDAARFCIDNVHAFLREQPLAHGNLAMKTKVGRILREPYGVIGIISPWNYPFSIPATETLAGLATGNAVVLKPSELTSLSAMQLATLLYDAGVPKDVFQVVVGDGKTGAALLDADINKLVFTGSVATGKRIAQGASARLLPVVLELGGKDPMIVLDDADLDVASSGAIWGAFVNAGQTCLSVERCYVHRSLYDKFLDMCVQKTKRLRIGTGLDEGTDVGPLIQQRQLSIVEAQVDEARSLGARVLAGGARLPELGPNFYAPTILADVTHEMSVMREETFGPVLPVMPFDSDEQVIELANDSEYGLGASVWTSNRRRGDAIAQRIQAGIVMVNDAVSCFGISEAPHGGVKASGIGRTHGRFGLEEMVRVKYLNDDRLPGMKKVWWYKYGKSFGRQMEGFLDLMFARSWTRRLGGAFHSTGALTRKDKI